MSVYSRVGGEFVRQWQRSITGVEVWDVYISEAAVIIVDETTTTHVYNLELTQHLHSYDHGTPVHASEQHVVFLSKGILSVRAVSGGS